MDVKTGVNIFNSRDNNADEYKLKREEESPPSSSNGVVFFKSSAVTRLVFNNIRFTPRVIEFVDAYEGKQFSEKFTIQNIGKHPVMIKIGEPNSFVFQLKKPLLHARCLVPGFCIRRRINYTYHNDDLVQKSQIPVIVDGVLIDYPIIVKVAEPEIEVQPQKLNFQVINLGATARSKTLTIWNTGRKRTKFEIDCGKNILDLVVNPTQGTVKAKHFVNIRVEIMGYSEGEFYQELWIKTSKAPIRVPILVEVVRPRLDIVYPKGTENFTLISFLPTFKGTKRASTFLLKNISTDSTMFVALAEVGGELLSFKEAQKLSYSFSMFKVTSEEGNLSPFEKRIFKVWFCPRSKVKEKGWRHQEDEKKGDYQCEHVVFFRINRVHCIERKELEKVEAKHTQSSLLINKSTHTLTSEKVDGKHTQSSLLTNKSADTLSTMHTINNQSLILNNCSREEKILRICLHGQAVNPEILIQPTTLEFGNLFLKQKENRVIKITNISIIPIRCKLLKTMNVTTVPQNIYLESQKAREILVRLTPEVAGRFHTKLKIQMLCESDDYSHKKGKTLATIGMRVVKLTYTAQLRNTFVTPKVGFGITPLIKDEVGFQKEMITYKDVCKLPKAAVLGLKVGFKPAWMKREKDQLKNVDNAMVALPNDRSRLYYTWPKDIICRTIFKGFFRYSPPEDLAYTLSLEGKIEKKHHRAIWSDYISKAIRQGNHTCLKELSDYVEDMPRHLFSPKLFKKLEEMEKDLLKIKKLSCNFKEKFNVSKYFFLPMSPMFLFLLIVEPKFINFNLVAVNSEAQESIFIRNMNHFPITIRFVAGCSTISVMEGSTNVVQPFETKIVYVHFQTKVLGRYFGFLDYVINGAHEFKITVSAFVTPKVLVLNDHISALEFGTYNTMEAFQPRSSFVSLENPLQATIKYKWDFSEDSAFATEITEGQIPPRSKLYSEVFFYVDPIKSFYSEATFISESGYKQLIKFAYPYKKVAVNFLQSNLDMDKISLNLATTAEAIIFNACYHDVSFVVMTPDPMPGVTIKPTKGVIKARSYYPLKVLIQIPVIMKFSFEVVLNVHFVHKISMRVTGNVVLPIIRMRPQAVIMRKICEQSFDTVSICAANEGTTPAELEIDFQSCPEFSLLNDESTVHLAPNCSANLNIKFEPKNVARYIFFLPVIINKILGPAVIQEQGTEFVSFYISDYEEDFAFSGDVFNSKNSKLKLPLVTINTNVVKGLINITPLRVNFKLESAVPPVFQPSIVLITNTSDKEVTFCIRNDDLGEINDSPFDLTPEANNSVEIRLKAMKAVLKPGRRLGFKATFAPKSPGNYKVDIPVFVRGYNDGLIYNYIQLEGTLKAPCLCPAVSEIHFPPLPLNVGSEVIVNVCAENHDTFDGIHCLVLDSSVNRTEISKQLLATKWIRQQNSIKCGEKSLFQLQITFQSSFPTGLRSYIILTDSSGAYSTILVTAIADNSALTTHTFLKTKTSKFNVVRQQVQAKGKPESSSFIKMPSKSEVKLHMSNEKTVSKYESRSATELAMDRIAFEVGPTVHEKCSQTAYNVPKLVAQMTKSMTRLTQMNFAYVTENPQCKFRKGYTSKGCDKTKIGTKSTGKIVLQTMAVSRSGSYSKFQNLEISNLEFSPTNDFKSANKFSGINNGETSFHDFPDQKYLQETLLLVERWIFEKLMRCSQYLSIPKSFQNVKPFEKPEKEDKVFDKKPQKKIEKDFLDFLEEIQSEKEFVRPHLKSCPFERAMTLRYYFFEILMYLEKKGCLLPHVRAEYLMEYEDYITYSKSVENVDCVFSPSLNVNKMNSSKFPEVRPIKTQSSIKYKVDRDTLLKEASSGSFFKEMVWTKSFLGDDFTIGDTEMESPEEKNPEQVQAQENDSTWDLLSERQFKHKVEILDKATFQSRSTEAWLDIAIQMFRVFVLKKVSIVKMNFQVTVIEMSKKPIAETFTVSSVSDKPKTKPQEVNFVSTEDTLYSNVYSVQERILLSWLNYHLQNQKNSLWKTTKDCLFRNKIINNFMEDLADSLALIAVTVSYCSYIVPDYFQDVFSQPDTPNQLHHNAGRLVQAWRTLEIGLTVETSDIVRPNPVFMIMLLTHLYEIMPLLRPNYNICFSAPLNSEVSRVIHLKNHSSQRLVFKAKLLGEHKEFFRVERTNPIEVKPLKTIRIKITFKVKKLRKMSGILFLSGYTESPDFAKHLTLYLEGTPSETPELRKFSLIAPLYKVICTEIPVKPPYPESDTYEVWYSNRKPEYSEDMETYVQPWSKILKKKVSRRFFPSKSEVTCREGTTTRLGVAVACLTNTNRRFWLMFRSKTADFVYLIEIQTKLFDPQVQVRCQYSESWDPSAECVCVLKRNTVKPISPNCPFSTQLKIPMRNNDLWEALRKMFLKTLLPSEKPFWSEHFELNIGICLVLWLLSPEEEAEVVDEFVSVLSTRVTYTLSVEPPNNKYVIIPPTIEIQDVRNFSDIAVPIHISQKAPQNITFKIKMVSENKKEIRSILVVMESSDPEKRKS